MYLSTDSDEAGALGEKEYEAYGITKEIWSVLNPQQKRGLREMRALADIQNPANAMQTLARMNREILSDDPLTRPIVEK